MKKIVILGCENSHATKFLSFLTTEERFADIKVIGVYSEEAEAAEKLNTEFGVPVMASYDAAVGQVDGVIITARHGAKHYEYAKPYIPSGVPMFIDKPITADADEAVTFMRELRAAGVRVTGGSSLRIAPEVQAVAEEARAEVGGKTVGGVVRAPLDPDPAYGGFWFYSQHLVEMIGEIFGRYPKSVRALTKEKQTEVLFRYEDYDVMGQFSQKSWQYFVSRFAETKTNACDVTSRGAVWFPIELDLFASLLAGGEQQVSYEDFIAPVFVIDAIIRAIESGEEEAVRGYEI
ncbi:MAG: Gfo/Idh/MocA family oxidoreductase [Clostridia bacterium]|nr:Gfo/Idh/MocA family oxidoreductase [Clostridia bacterium]